ncbi:hypothetical protein P3G55_25500, partial [Leptospira sp. 96542]|nr:hypothetical protein [Leptospira sp. 96542]
AVAQFKLPPGAMVDQGGAAARRPIAPKTVSLAPSAPHAPARPTITNKSPRASQPSADDNARAVAVSKPLPKESASGKAEDWETF